MHVVAPVLFSGHNVYKFRINPGRIVSGWEIGRIFLIVGWQVIQESFDHLQARRFVGRHEMGVSTDLAVHRRPTQLLHGHFLAGHGLYYLRSRNEHVGRALDHEGKVGKGRRVHGSSRARAEDDGDLGHHA